MFLEKGAFSHRLCPCVSIGVAADKRLLIVHDVLRVHPENVPDQVLWVRIVIKAVNLLFDEAFLVAVNVGRRNVG